MNYSVIAFFLVYNLKFYSIITVPLYLVMK